jgi:hypothetical protein
MQRTRLAGLALTCLINASALQARSRSTPKFDVVSIKPCKLDLASGGRAGRIKSSPGRLSVECVPVRVLIQHAYLIYAGGRYRDFNFYDVPIEGTPAWTQSDRYTIEAITEGSQSEGLMNGHRRCSKTDSSWRFTAKPGTFRFSNW